MESPALGLSVLGLLAVAALILTNAYFVATEFALVAVRRTQVELWRAEGRRGAASAAQAIDQVEQLINLLGIICLVGQKFVCLGVGQKSLVLGKFNKLRESDLILGHR